MPLTDESGADEGLRVLALLRRLVGPPVKKCDWCGASSRPLRVAGRFCRQECRDAERAGHDARARRWRACGLRGFAGWLRAARIAFAPVPKGRREREEED